MTPQRRDAFAVAAVALAARLAVAAWAGSRFPPVDDSHYYDVFARRLASGQGYTWAWPDRAVTYAAHYPVGYPALLAVAYRFLGPSPLVAMIVNALLGAASAYAVHRLVDAPGIPRWRPTAAGLAVALHPALVAYTPALMTEGVTGSLLAIAAAFAARARAARAAGQREWPWLAAVGAATAIATLVRPQSLALAPVWGAVAVPSSATVHARLARAGAVVAVALACIAPWTARNCARMHRCALVSVNEGWNLLIGATTSTGGWQELTVPPECATVWDEAGKDVCFDRAAREIIARAPWAWIARAPAKVAMTLDSFGAGPYYLHKSNPEAFGDRDKTVLGDVEAVYSRVALLAALVACGLLAGPRALTRKVVALVGSIAALTVHGWIGYLAIPVAVATLGPRAIARMPTVVPGTAAVVALTILVHAAFFGAGRYGLVVAPFVAALAFAAAGTARRAEARTAAEC
jgi:hypothetical protein